VKRMYQASGQYGKALLKQELQYFHPHSFKAHCDRTVKGKLGRKAHQLFCIIDDLYKEETEKKEAIGTKGNGAEREEKEP
jgi:hypothetical protein